MPAIHEPNSPPGHAPFPTSVFLHVIHFSTDHFATPVYAELLLSQLQSIYSVRFVRKYREGELKVPCGASQKKMSRAFNVIHIN